MADLEDWNEVLMDGIDKAIEVHLGEVGIILGCKQAWREAEKGMEAIFCLFVLWLRSSELLNVINQGAG